jgi:hypothetical protein
MPVNVVRTDENGAKVEEVLSGYDGALHWAAEHPGEYPQLSRIDVYGETVIEREDLDGIIAEWHQLVDEATNDRELAYVLGVRDILNRARQRPGSSVRFIGD